MVCLLALSARYFVTCEWHGFLQAEHLEEAMLEATAAASNAERELQDGPFHNPATNAKAQGTRLNMVQQLMIWDWMNLLENETQNFQEGFFPSLVGSRLQERAPLPELPQAM